MAFIGEAMIEINLEDFWDYVRKLHPDLETVVYGVPVCNKNNQTLEINIAFGTSDVSPHDWSEVPKAISEWKEQQ